MHDARVAAHVVPDVQHDDARAAVLALAHERRDRELLAPEERARDEVVRVARLLSLERARLRPQVALACSAGASVRYSGPVSELTLFERVVPQLRDYGQRCEFALELAWRVLCVRSRVPRRLRVCGGRMVRDLELWREGNARGNASNDESQRRRWMTVECLPPRLRDRTYLEASKS